MDLNDHRGRFGAGKKFKTSNIIGDPFSLATLGVAVGGWLIAFVSSILADIDDEYPNYAWWSLVYMFFCIIGVFITVATDSVYTYHVAIVGFMAAGLVFTTSSTNSLIYYPEGSKEAGAAGFILLSMVQIVWIFYYGSQPQAAHRQTIASFALHKDHSPSRASRHMTQSFRPETAHSGPNNTMYNSSALPGFETTSPITGQPVNRYNTEPKRESTAVFHPPNHQVQPLSTQPSQTQLQPGNAFAIASQQQQQPQPPQAQSQQQMPCTETSVPPPAEYPYRAKAIYSYEANPDDPNEISFSKHEILEVSDVSGRWWQAKKATGETGIAPSNYLILL